MSSSSKKSNYCDSGKKDPQVMNLFSYKTDSQFATDPWALIRPSGSKKKSSSGGKSTSGGGNGSGIKR